MDERDFARFKFMMSFGQISICTAPLVPVRLRHITVIHFNPLRAKFFRSNINIYSHFVSFLHIDTTQVVEILPQVRQEPTYST